MKETRASEIMASDVLTIKKGATLEDAIKLLVNHRITGLPVVDKNGRLVGVVSEFDIIEQVRSAGKLKANVFKKEFQYTEKIEAVSENLTLEKIIDRFVNTKVRRLPVLNSKEKLVGIITRRDVMKLLYYRAKLV